MLTDEQLEILSDALTPLYQRLEAQVIADIARRVKKTMILTRTAELQAMSMQKLGFSPARIRAEVMKLLRADKAFQKLVVENTVAHKKQVKELIAGIVEDAKKAGNEVVGNAGNMSWIDDMRVWGSAGKTLTKDSSLTQLTEVMARHTGKELKNLTRSTGFKTMRGFESTENLYRLELDKALIKFSSGTFSSDQCVRDIVRELSQSGIRTIDYAGGRSYQLDTAARMCLRTASNQLAAQIMDMNMVKTSENLVQVSAHWGARDNGKGIGNHKLWQGKVYSTDGKKHHEEENRIGQIIRDLFTYTGYNVKTGIGSVLGLHGVNCRHQHYVFFEGVSTPIQYPPEPESKVINGKEYDYYAMTQAMRSKERAIRALKREREALQKLGMDATDMQAKIRQSISNSVMSAESELKATVYVLRAVRPI